MPLPTKHAPVPFDEVKKSVNKLSEMLEKVQNGETLSKRQGKILLLAYRKELSAFSKLIIGARLYASQVEDTLVTKKVADRETVEANEGSDVDLDALVDEKVEVPE